MSYELRIPKQELSDVIVDNRMRAGIHYWNDYDSGPSFWSLPDADVYDLGTYGLLLFAEPPVMLGDMNTDGTVDLVDVIFSLQVCSGLEPNNCLVIPQLL